jgi:hypothetical protein
MREVRWQGIALVTQTAMNARKRQRIALILSANRWHQAVTWSEATNSAQCVAPEDEDDGKGM